MSLDSFPSHSRFGVAARSRPSPSELALLVQPSRPEEFRFGNDGLIPNHPAWPLLLFTQAVTLPASFDPFAVMNEVFARNGWRESWFGIFYNFLHYHSRVHEVFGVARGEAVVRFGGEAGRAIALGPGDVVVIPAGTGHQGLTVSEDFAGVFAYAPSGTYDECRPDFRDYDARLRRIAETPKPATDPVFGSAGPLLDLWSSG